jgi:hypothetical protein
MAFVRMVVRVIEFGHYHIHGIRRYLTLWQ